MPGLLATVASWCYKATIHIVSMLVTMPIAKRPFQDFDPKKYGLRDAINLRIPFSPEDGADGELAAWFVRPENKGLSAERRWNEMKGDETEAEEGADGNPTRLTDPDEVVVMYLHGNSYTRAMGQRVSLYKVLLSLRIAVLAVDYRNYADSSKISRNTETAFVEDAALSFRWLRRHVHPSSKIVVWGHSLGTGVAAALGAALSDRRARPDGYVLEAPFVSLLDVVEYHKFTSVISFFGGNAASLFEDCDLTFKSGDLIKSIREPIAILHAKDDAVVAHASGEKLYLEAVEGNCHVTMHSYDEELALGHFDIHLARGLTDDIANFLTFVKRERP